MTDPSASNTVRIWDLPVRLVHWSFAILLPVLWWSAEKGHLDLHKKVGMGMLGLVVFRLVWGLVGSSTARFSSFVRGPQGIIDYLRPKNEDVAQIVGHNPLGALSVLGLLGLLTVQVALGLIAQDTDGIASGPLNHLVSWDTAEAASAAHGAVFNLLLALVVLHLAAIFYYRVFKRENLVKPMLNGTKAFALPVEAPRIAPLWRALLVAVGAATLAMWLAWGAPPWGSPWPWDQTAEPVDVQSYM